jgi:hypothetical protein
MVVRRAPSETVWAVSRILAGGPQDLPAVERLAARQRIAPAREPIETGGGDALEPLQLADLPAAQDIARLPPGLLFHRLQQLIARAPASARDSLAPAVAARLAQLPEPGPDGEWPEPLRLALSRGFADGLARVLEQIRGEPGEDSWRGRSAARGGDPLARAARALSALGAAAPEDVLTLSCASDESGRPLSGGERYRIHFAPEALPPALATWRLSCGATTGGERAGVIGERDGLALNQDGSLDILIQSAAPAPHAGLNWLACPAGLFDLTINLYWPARAALDGAWRMASVERLGSRFLRRKGAKAPPRPAPAKPAPTGHGRNAGAVGVSPDSEASTRVVG